MVTREDVINAQKEYDALCTRLTVDTESMKTICHTSKNFPRDFVIDENKSVKWNREEVVRLNEEYHRKKQEGEDLKFKAALKVRNALKQYIMDKYGFCNAVIDRMIIYISDKTDICKYSDSAYNLMECLEGLGQLIVDCIKDCDITMEMEL